MVSASGQSQLACIVHDVTADMLEGAVGAHGLEAAGGRTQWQKHEPADDRPHLQDLEHIELGIRCLACDGRRREECDQASHLKARLRRWLRVCHTALCGKRQGWIAAV